MLLLTGKIHGCVSVAHIVTPAHTDGNFVAQGGLRVRKELSDSAPPSLKDAPCLIARRAETRGFQPFNVFSSTTSLPLCFGRSLKDNSCLLNQGVRGKPGSGCTMHVCAGQWTSAPQQRDLVLGQSCPVSAAGVGRDRLSNAPRGRGGASQIFQQFFLKREGEMKKTPMYKMQWSVDTLCSLYLFLYFCGSA